MRQALLRIALAVVGALPWLSALGALPPSLKHAIELAFLASCHHAPERTLVVRSTLMCVCSRCAGIYAGIALAAVASWSQGAERPWRNLFAAGLAIMFADIVTQDLGLHAPWHAVRLATGAVVGGAAAAWMLASCPFTPAHHLTRDSGLSLLTIQSQSQSRSGRSPLR